MSAASVLGNGARRLGSSITRDTVLAWRNGQVGVTLAIMALMILLVALLPEAAPRSRPYAYLDASEDGWLEAAIARSGRPEPWSRQGDEAALDAAVREGALGLEARGDSEAPEARVRAGTTAPEANVRALEALAGYLHGMATAGEPAVEVHTVGLGRVEMPLYLKGVPIFIVFEVGILGFLLVAVFMFQEKAEGTIRAYRATPGGAAAYVASKALLFVGISVLYALGVVVAVLARGTRPDLPYLFAMVIASSATMTLLGLAFASFFQNLSQWFFPGVGVLILNLAPMVSYAMPGFSPSWIRWLPSYDAVFMTRDALLGGGVPASGGSVLRVAIWLAASAALALLAARERLLKDTR